MRYEPLPLEKCEFIVAMSFFNEHLARKTFDKLKDAVDFAYGVYLKKGEHITICMRVGKNIWILDEILGGSK